MCLISQSVKLPGLVRLAFVLEDLDFVSFISVFEVSTGRLFGKKLLHAVGPEAMLFLTRSVPERVSSKLDKTVSADLPRASRAFVKNLAVVELAIVTDDGVDEDLLVQGVKFFFLFLVKRVVEPGKRRWRRMNCASPHEAVRI